MFLHNANIFTHFNGVQMHIYICKIYICQICVYVHKDRKPWFFSFYLVTAFIGPHEDFCFNAEGFLCRLGIEYTVCTV